ncbi:MAG: hypothetical protein AMXMBFR72_36890 [Betaproteobacteria bacterium]
MSTSSPKWSRKSAHRASGARNAALAAVAAAFVAACSGGGGDAGIGLPPGQGPINWGAVQTLATNANNVTPPAAVFGANGTVSVLWGQIGMPLPGGGTSTVPLVGVRENTSGTTTFTTAESIDETLAFNAADVISDLRGERSAFGSMAVWRRQLSGSGTRLVSAVREANGWGVLPIATPSAGSVADDLTFAANDAGAQVAVWTQIDINANGVRRVRLSARSGAAGWSQALSVSGTTQDASQPTVAIDSAGVAMIVWRQGAATGVLRARSYNTTTGQFGNELEVDPGQFTNDTRNPHVVALAPGSFLATWEQAGLGGAYDMRANTGSATAWQVVSATLELGAGTVDQSLVVAGPNATAYAVWRQNSTIFFGRYAAGTWSVARQVSGTVASHTPRVAVDGNGNGNGNAIFVWLQTPSGGFDDLFYATFTASNSAISGAFQLDTEATGAAASPSLSVAANGAAVVAWLQNVGGQSNPNVVARVFRP